MDGIRLSGSNLEVESTRIIVAIQKERGEGDTVSVCKMASSSHEHVINNIDHNKLKVLEKIKLDHIDLFGFYYLTPEQIQLTEEKKIKN